MFSPLEKDRVMQNLNGTGDIEDLLTSDKGLTKTTASHGFNSGKENHLNRSPSAEGGSDHRKNQQKSVTRSNEPLRDDSADERVDRSTDYQGWLDARKRKWKYVHEQKKRRR
jgi:DNA polymerase epsilon subunit 1